MISGDNTTVDLGLNLSENKTGIHHQPLRVHQVPYKPVYSYTIATLEVVDTTYSCCYNIIITYFRVILQLSEILVAYLRDNMSHTHIFITFIIIQHPNDVIQ